MADLSRFRTAHQLARELLAGPDHIVVMPMPTFDMPGSYIAYPVHFQVEKVEDKDVVALLPDAQALVTTEPLPQTTQPTAPDAAATEEAPRTEGQ